MKLQAAVIDGVNAEWDVREVELRETEIRPGGILIRMGAAGLCHTDEHIRHGELPAQFPLVGGHEGAGVAVTVGEGLPISSPATTWSSPSVPAAGSAATARMARPTCARKSSRSKPETRTLVSPRTALRSMPRAWSGPLPSTPS